MLYIKKLNTSQVAYSEMVTVYNDIYANFCESAEKLHILRKESVEFLDHVELLSKSFTDAGANFIKALSDISVSKATFRNTLSNVNACDTMKIIVGISKTGAPILREIAPDVAMWVATFGTASTGRAISELQGIAQINAQKAYLGGGAKSKGGRGIAGGEAFLAMIGPAVEIGFVVSTALAVPAFRNYSAAKRINKEREKLQHDLFLLTKAKTRIDTLRQNTESILNSCRSTYESTRATLNIEGACSENNDMYGKLIEECSTLATYLNQTV